MDINNGTTITCGIGNSTPSKIANLILSTPNFNGVLKIEGCISCGKLRNAGAVLSLDSRGYGSGYTYRAIDKSQNEQIKALQQIRIVDITDVLDVSRSFGCADFTQYCNNIKFYKGASLDNILSMGLNVVGLDLSLYNTAENKSAIEKVNEIKNSLTVEPERDADFMIDILTNTKLQYPEVDELYKAYRSFVKYYDLSNYGEFVERIKNTFSCPRDEKPTGKMLIYSHTHRYHVLKKYAKIWLD